MNNLLLSLILLIACVGSASATSCYYCSNCPTPFNPYSISVTKVASYTGYCLKKSNYEYDGAPASRGADPGICRWYGCRWTYDETSRYVYACCCTRDYCNTGSFTSKSTTTVLLGALALLAVNRYV